MSSVSSVFVDFITVLLSLLCFDFWTSSDSLWTLEHGCFSSLLYTKAVRQKRLSFLQSAGVVVSAVQLEGGAVLGKAMGEFSRGYRIPAG